jgi:hypothetical protein
MNSLLQIDCTCKGGIHKPEGRVELWLYLAHRVRRQTGSGAWRPSQKPAENILRRDPNHMLAADLIGALN